jgi:hypothetical protein
MIDKHTNILIPDATYLPGGHHCFLRRPPRSGLGGSSSGLGLTNSSTSSTRSTVAIRSSTSDRRISDRALDPTHIGAVNASLGSRYLRRDVRAKPEPPHMLVATGVFGAFAAIFPREILIRCAAVSRLVLFLGVATLGFMVFG